MIFSENAGSHLSVCFVPPFSVLMDFKHTSFLTTWPQHPLQTHTLPSFLMIEITKLVTYQTKGGIFKLYYIKFKQSIVNDFSVTGKRTGRSYPGLYKIIQNAGLKAFLKNCLGKKNIFEFCLISTFCFRIPTLYVNIYLIRPRRGFHASLTEKFAR